MGPVSKHLSGNATYQANKTDRRIANDVGQGKQFLAAARGTLVFTVFINVHRPRGSRSASR